MAEAAQLLNEHCRCVMLDRQALADGLRSAVPEFADQILERRLHLFADLPFFVAADDVLVMDQTIAALDRIFRTLQWQQASGATSQLDGITGGVGPGLMWGMDFHLGPDGPRLIEVNTNAGGAFLNVALAAAQRACCTAIDGVVPDSDQLTRTRDRLVEMFRHEYAVATGGRALGSVAIVDDAPARQPLYPEFLMAAQLLAAAGIRTVIADPAELTVRDGRLWIGDQVIDLIYNRHTDFLLTGTEVAVLRQVWQGGVAVVSPNPFHYQMGADKRNLVRLSDGAGLAAMGIQATDIEILGRTIPPIRLVTPDDAERLWAERRDLFFKPVSGFGSRGAYRGDKLTRGKWDQILADPVGYVAQQQVPPSGRTIELDGAEVELKADVRNYVYDGQVLLRAARLYRGQVTNMRTPGGGFAPVYSAPADGCC